MTISEIHSRAKDFGISSVDTSIKLIHIYIVMFILFSFSKLDFCISLNEGKGR